MSHRQLAALAAAVIMCGLALFHAGLALGAPWGAFVWGGQDEPRLSQRMQLGSALLVPVLLAMALMVLVRAGLLYAGSATTMVWPTWAVFCFLITSFFGSLRSESRRERRFTAPVLLVGAVLTGYLAGGMS